MAQYDTSEMSNWLSAVPKGLGSNAASFQRDELLRRKTVDSFGSHDAEDPPYERDGGAVDRLLVGSPDMLKTGLLRMAGEQADLAVGMLNDVSRFTAEPENSQDKEMLAYMAGRIVDQCMNAPALADELYVQLKKYSSSSVSLPSKIRVWQLWLVLAASIPPSKDDEVQLCEFIEDVSLDQGEDADIRAVSERVSFALKRSIQGGRRKNGMQSSDIVALWENTQSTTSISFMDGSNVSMEYGPLTVAKEAVEIVAKNINLENFSSFALFRPRTDDDSFDASEEYTLLDDTRFIADALTEAKAAGMEGNFLFKKKIFREQDEHITEPAFINLSYAQVKNDFLQGNYPVVSHDACQMGALQILIAHGPNLNEMGNEFVREIERNIPRQLLATRPAEEWRREVYQRYDALSSLTQEQAKLQFLRIVRNVPYGNSVFFSVKKVADPIGLLPTKLMLGINKRGVHFFRPVPKTYLLSAELRDIMKFGSSTQAVFLKMRVAGVLYVFQFETNEGEHITAVLGKHVGDLVMKRNEKVKAHSRSNHKARQEMEQANFGQKYKSHLNSMKRNLEEAVFRITELEENQQKASFEVEEMRRELGAIRESMTRYEERKVQLQADLSAVRKAACSCKEELHERKAELAAIEVMKVSQVREVEAPLDSEQMAQLQAGHEQVLAELKEAEEREQEISNSLDEVEAQKSEVKRRLDELESLKETEVDDMKAELDDIKATSKHRISAKDDKVNDLQEDLARMTAKYTADMNEMAQMKEDQTELVGLRQFKQDVKRKEKERASVIEGQGSRIDYLEKQYKEEQVMRKRYFNQMEDMKGKIRVYCRVRPMLPFEKNKGQSVAIAVPDELTIGHPWKDEKKNREYVFDTVFTPEISQEKVFEGTKHLIQSAIDGFNVCIFAYGQTGSGKTFTIYGSDDNPGLTPRGIFELFHVIERDSNKYTATVKCYMLELYTDYLVDLLAPEKQKKPAKLEIKKDAKGMVVVNGATLIEVNGAQHLMDTIEYGQKRRHVSSTNMNRESSRSHLIMSFIIECTNLQTQAITRGKLSFVDLAGSERVKKSGATGDQMKEAQAINKSLSALGDVISSLATGTGHVPYRNHKLTMLMSDSLGGNAKTLMFVNVSPTDSNVDETQNSLVYATRVRAIKNDPSKMLAGKEQARIKKLVDQWRVGKADYADEALIDCE